MNQESTSDGSTPNDPKSDATMSGHRLGSKPLRLKVLAAVSAIALVGGAAFVSTRNPSNSIDTTTQASTRPTTGTDSVGSENAAATKASYDKVVARKVSPTLTVEFASPKGKIATNTSSNEIRWLFDRPVVNLTSVATETDPSPFVNIEPAIAGKFRWGSTRLLIFTPTTKLPGATTYTATLSGLAGLDATKLTMPYVLSFSTPTPRCSIVDAEPPFFRATCDQEIDETSLAKNTTVIYRPLAFESEPAMPAANDLAAMMAIDPVATKALVETLKQSPLRKASAQNVLLTDTQPCSTEQTTVLPICYTLRATGAVNLDASASLRFGSGIKSSEGQNPSDVVVEGDIATKREAFILHGGCQIDCNPNGFSTQATVDFTPESLDGRLSVKDTQTGITTTYTIPPDSNLENLPYPFNNPIALSWAKLKAGGSYEVTVLAGALSTSGQPLKYTSITSVSLGHEPALAQLSTGGELVTEATVRGLTFETVNVTSIDQVSRSISRKELVALVRSYADGSKSDVIDLKKEKATSRAITAPPDTTKVETIPLPKAEPGVFLVAIKPTGFVPKSQYRDNGFPLGDAVESYGDGPTGPSGGGWSSALVQRGDTAVTLKRSPANVLVAVTSLSTGKPIANANVSLYGLGDAAYWTGKTNADGVIAAPISKEKLCARICDLIAVVDGAADGTGMLAYAQSYWRAWGDDIASPDEEPPVEDQGPLVDTVPPTTLAPPELEPGQRVLASLFTDRGVYRAGEEVHLKGLVRIQTPQTLELPTAVKQTQLLVVDPRDTQVISKVVAVDNGSFETTFTVPVAAAQGRYYVNIDGGSTSFLVTSFRKPDFIVDVKAKQKSYVRGQTVEFSTDARYLFGAPMAGTASSGVFTSSTTYVDPVAGKEELGLSDMRWTYSCFDPQAEDCELGGNLDSETSATLNDVGNSIESKPLTVITGRHQPVQLQFESNVTDVSRQTFAGRDTTIIHPGEVYVGIRQQGSLTNVTDPIVVDVAAVTAEGGNISGLAGEVTLTHWEYITTKRLNDDGTSSLVGSWRGTVIDTKSATLASTPTTMSFTTTKSGYYEARVSSVDTRGNYVEANTEIYVLGADYVPWYQQVNDPIITMVSDKSSYAPGDVARVLVQSPWAQAEGLLTLERNGVLLSRRFSLSNSASALEIPITPDLAPNVFATVTLFKGRTAPPSAKNPTDPGRPQIQTGTLELLVPPTQQTLKVGVQTNRTEYLPGSPATATITVKDAQGKPASGEVTLYAVDEGVLRLTGYQNPDVLADLYPQRYLEVLTADSRMRLVATPTGEKGDSSNQALPEPGGGGDEGGSEANTGDDVRSDFRLLAAWSGKVSVDSSGKAVVPMKLPESLTAFRVIAVAASGAEKFGTGKSDITVRKPFLMLPNLPRFVSVGDTFEAGVVVRNDTGTTQDATITLSLPTDSPVVIDGPASIVVPQLSAGPHEVRFRLKAVGLGASRFTFKGTLSETSATDSLAITVPVSVTRRYETVVDTGTVQAGGKAASVGLILPKNIEPSLGGLELTTSSSALAGLQEGITSLTEYPYGCLEQRSSRIRVLLDLASLSDTYSLPGLKTGTIKKVVQAEINKISDYAIESGGLAYWPGGTSADYFLTPRVLLLLQDAKAAGYTVPAGLLENLKGFLLVSVTALNDEFPTPGIAPSRSQISWALARAGEPQPALMDVLFEDRFQLSYLEQVHLLRAQLESGLVGEAPNAMLSLVLGSVQTDGTEASVQERYDWSGWRDYGYLQGGEVHDTSVVLALLSRIDPQHPLIAPMSRWLLRQRTNGTWNNTLESGYALQALLEVARNTEAKDPQFTAVVALGATELTSQKFDGRSLNSTLESVPMDRLASVLPTGTGELTVNAKGTGTLQYTNRLRYVPTFESLKAVDQGFSVERTYHPYVPLRADANTRITAPAATSFAAGDLVEVIIKITTAEYRQNIVIDDPLPAGLEALNTLLDSTSQGDSSGEDLYGIDHTEIRDDRILMFATTLSAGTTELRYIARATTAGVFMVAPTQVEDMYRSEIFGHNASMRFTVTP